MSEYKNNKENKSILLWLNEIKRVTMFALIFRYSEETLEVEQFKNKTEIKRLRKNFFRFFCSLAYVQMEFIFILHRHCDLLCK